MFTRPAGRRHSLAGPVALALAVGAFASGAIILGLVRWGPLASEAAGFLWWPLNAFWLVAAFIALRRREYWWVVLPGPFVLYNLAVYSLLVVACWKSCEL